MKSLLMILIFTLTGPLFAKSPTVIMETNHGKVTIELFDKKAPISTKNFLSYVNKGFYNGLIFHRVIPGFMIQGGGFGKVLNKKETYATIKNEAANGLSNQRGTLAMARTSSVNSATSQFFINVVDNKFLDHKSNNPRGFGYAVFGKVIKGLDIVDKIRVVKTGVKNGMRDVPLDNVIITKMTVVK